MAATLIDTDQGTEEKHVGAVDNSATDHAETLYDEVEDTSEVEEETTNENAEEELPEKYRGKTVAEIARMHTEAEKQIGKQSNEVGELRQAFDEFVQSSVKTKDEPAQEIDPSEFFSDPNAAMERAIANHPKLRQAEAVTAEMKKNNSLARLKSEFPDMQNTLQDVNFQQWVQASPIRKQLFANADRHYDYDSAAELLGNYRARQGVVEQTKQVEKKMQSNELKKASTGAARSNPDARRTKKVYRRSDIIKLMKHDPARYESLADDIMAAYSEGRVK